MANEQRSAGGPVEEDGPEWFRYPLVSKHPDARRWLESEYLLGLAPNTIEAYGRGMEDFLGFCQRAGADPATATKVTIAQYVGDLRRRPGPKGRGVIDLGSGAGLSNSTLQQRLTSVRLFFDFLVEVGLRETNPVGRGRYTPGKHFGARAQRGLLPRFHKLPWIPSDADWMRFLDAARSEPIRNRCMLHEIATFAGHRNTATTLQYIHLSGRDLAERLNRGMEQIHAWRVRTVAETFGKGEGAR